MVWYSLRWHKESVLASSCPIGRLRADEMNREKTSDIGVADLNDVECDSRRCKSQQMGCLLRVIHVGIPIFVE